MPVGHDVTPTSLSGRTAVHGTGRPAADDADATV